MERRDSPQPAGSLPPHWDRRPTRVSGQRAPCRQWRPACPPAANTACASVHRAKNAQAACVSVCTCKCVYARVYAHVCVCVCAGVKSQGRKDCVSDCVRRRESAQRMYTARAQRPCVVRIRPVVDDVVTGKACANRALTATDADECARNSNGHPSNARTRARTDWNAGTCEQDVHRHTATRAHRCPRPIEGTVHGSGCS